MSEAYVGEIRRVSFNFAPRGWALCNGQLMQISQNQALFSLLGTNYGGDGRTTFALPDLRGRAPIHAGQTPWRGEVGGQEQVALNVQNLPAHSHVPQVSSAAATATSPQGGHWASTGQPAFGADVAGVVNAAAVSVSGQSQPHENRPPYVVINYIIALSGIYPSRN